MKFIFQLVQQKNEIVPMRTNHLTDKIKPSLIQTHDPIYTFKLCAN